MAEERVLVSVIIPTYNRRDDVIRCVDSFLASNTTGGGYLEIIIVDNASDDDTVERVTEKYRGNQEVRIIELPTNMMAAGGRNAGIKEAHGKFLLFSDSDNIVDPNMVSFLVRAMERDRTIGMIGPVMLYYRKPEMVWFAGNDFNMFTTKVKYRYGGKNISEVGQEGVYETHHLPNMMMVRKEVQNKVGLFDESYYIMFEEADYAMRVRKAGWRVMVCRDALTYHNVFLPEEVVDNKMRSLGLDNPQRAFHFGKNRGIFMKKYAPWYGRLAYMLFFRFLFAGYYCIEALKCGRQDIARGYWRGVFYHKNRSD